ncbi:hypothetical protein L3X37_06580 [Sabulilitoribacter arenilitoris]|uniref:Uncharacterized protein n=1 Tax=Wocania arenilitoris TaxID=2044858 RepID=A0AAE3JP95_9FLAO|nr:hypothetical protein [Wocania arenilitoris]MCF7568030.1 hypothetical protein [Wocania arenilitoris]
MKKHFHILEKWFDQFFMFLQKSNDYFNIVSKVILITTSLLLFVYTTMLVIEVNASWMYLRFASIFLVLVLFAIILNWIFDKVIYIPKLFRAAIVVSAPILFMVSERDPIIVAFLLFFFTLIGSLIYLFSRNKFSSYSLFIKTISCLGIILAMSLSSIAIWFYSIPGFEMKETINAASFSMDRKIKISSPAVKGNYEVEEITYGSGNDKNRLEFGANVNIKTTSINCNNFIGNWSGINGWWRTKYWGFDATKIPLNGRVWCPKTKGKFPLVLIIHGDHPMQDHSDGGYGYLGQLLSSRGYVVVSVDQNFINVLWSYTSGVLFEENDARAIILLEHLKLWHAWNKDSEHMFYQKIDTNNIALIGHSRGGEAISHAALINKLPYYPDNALIKFDYNYRIKSLLAIGAVDGQYKPSNDYTKLENINYLSIHGTHDGEVTDFMGLKQFGRINFTDSLYHIKSAILIDGANHGQFNSTWGNKDSYSPFSKLLNLKGLMSEKNQQQIAKVYISGFLDATLKESKAYLPLFKITPLFREWVPDIVLMNEFEDSNSHYLCTFDEDFDLSTTTTNSGIISSKNLSLWKEKKYKRGSKALVLGWNETENLLKKEKPYFNINFPVSIKNINTNSVFTFSIRDSRDNHESLLQIASKNKEKVEALNKSDFSKNHLLKQKLIDFSIILSDIEGKKVTFLLSDYSYLQIGLKHAIMKTDFITNDFKSIPMMQTYSFPLKDLIKINSKIDFDKITNIQFLFNKTQKGVITIDNIGFTKN